MCSLTLATINKEIETTVITKAELYPSEQIIQEQTLNNRAVQLLFHPKLAWKQQSDFLHFIPIYIDLIEYSDFNTVVLPAQFKFRNCNNLSQAQVVSITGQPLTWNHKKNM